MPATPELPCSGWPIIEPDTGKDPFPPPARAEPVEACRPQACPDFPGTAANDAAWPLRRSSSPPASSVRGRVDLFSWMASLDSRIQLRSGHYENFKSGEVETALTGSNTIATIRSATNSAEYDLSCLSHQERISTIPLAA